MDLATIAAEAIRAKRHSLGYGHITTVEEDAAIIQRDVVLPMQKDHQATKDVLQKYQDRFGSYDDVFDMKDRSYF
jgi:hypothetical protein